MASRMSWRKVPSNRSIHSAQNRIIASFPRCSRQGPAPMSLRLMKSSRILAKTGSMSPAARAFIASRAWVTFGCSMPGNARDDGLRQHLPIGRPCSQAASRGVGGEFGAVGDAELAEDAAQVGSYGSRGDQQ